MKKFLLSLMIALTALWASALEFDVALLHYSIDSDGTARVARLSTAGASANPTTITIPGRVTYNNTTYRVDVIGTGAFKNNTTVKWVNVGWGVRYINSEAFSGCTNIQQMHLPSSVKYILSKAFAGCSKLGQFDISCQTPPSLASDAFQNAKKPSILTSTTSGENAFKANSSWTAVSSDIHKNSGAAHDVWYSGQGYDYISTNLDTPNPDVMLVNCSNTYVATPSTVYDTWPRDYGGGGQTYCLLKKIAPYACKGNTSITSMGRSDTYSTSLTEIGEYAFEGCTSLQNVYTDATSIGSSAFLDCTNLKTLQLYYTAGENSGVQSIGEDAFRNTGLTSLYIPASVTSIGAGAFCRTKSLEKISVSSSNKNYAHSTGGWLMNKSFTTVVQVPGANNVSSFVSGTTSINSKAFYGNTKISSLWIPYGVTYIGSFAFGYMDNLVALKLPSSVTSLHQYALDYLKNLYDLYVNFTTPPSSITNASSSLDQIRQACRLHVPHNCVSAYKNAARWNQMTTVDEAAFDIVYNNLYFTVKNNSSYIDTKVQSSATNGYVYLVKGYYANSAGVSQPSGGYTIPNTVSDNGKTFIVAGIEDRVFSNNTGLTSISGGAGVRWINDYAFYGCTNLTKSSIPYPSYLGKCVFMNSSKLADVALGDRLATIEEFAFSGTAIKQLIMPNTVSKIGTQFVYECNSLDSIKLSTSLTEIPNYAFSKCRAKYIRLPYGVKTIGVAIVANQDYSYAVNHVVVVPSSVTSINANAFKFADKLESVYLNIPHDRFITNSECWIRSGSNYNHKGITKLYVPVGEVAKYEGDAGVKAAFYMSDVNPGSFDFHYGDPNTNLGSMYYMTVVDASAKTAKYVYSPHDTGGSYVISSSETDKLTGVEYKMVEVGDSACAGHTKVTRTSFASTITKVGSRAFYGCSGMTGEINIPSTIKQLGGYSFWGCSGLSSIFLESASTNIYYGLVGNMSNSFRFYIPIGVYYSWYKWADWSTNGAKGGDLFSPYIKPSTEWTAISVMKPVSLPTNDGVEFYTIPSYDSSKEMVATSKRTGSVAAATGLLMKGTVGKVYRFFTTSSSTAPANLLRGVEGEKIELSPSGAYFTFNTSTKKFDRITKTTNIWNGGAYLEMGSLVGSGTQTIQIDKFYTPTTIRGDVDGSGEVDIDDLNIIINIMVKKATKSQWPNADVDKNGEVDIDDLNIVINIMVHKDNG